jgi:hypothetical protein
MEYRQRSSLNIKHDLAEYPLLEQQPQAHIY